MRWRGAGQLATGFVEAVDLFPTIVELAMPSAGNLAVPRCLSAAAAPAPGGAPIQS